MNINDFARKKALHEKISMITCYDYPSACIVNETPIDCVLVGDSVAMAVHGHPTTVMATIEMMILHTEAVCRGIKHPLVISDLPFLAHRSSPSETIHQVKRLMQAGAQAIKIEGGDDHTVETVKFLSTSGVPVIGHIGLTPQSVCQLGGFKIQGKDKESAEQLLNQAEALEKAGCKALVIECIPASLAEAITQSIAIPTIGIGAGGSTDGQVLVWHDLLGIQDDFRPRFLKQYTHSKKAMVGAINDYVQQVKQQLFPTSDHSY